MISIRQPLPLETLYRNADLFWMALEFLETNPIRLPTPPSEGSARVSREWSHLKREATTSSSEALENLRSQESYTPVGKRLSEEGISGFRIENGILKIYSNSHKRQRTL